MLKMTLSDHFCICGDHHNSSVAPEWSFLTADEHFSAYFVLQDILLEAILLFLVQLLGAKINNSNMADENQSNLIPCDNIKELNQPNEEQTNNMDNVDASSANSTGNEGAREHQRPQVVVGLKRELDRFNQFARNLLTQARQKYSRLNVLKQKDSDRKQEEMTLEKDDGNMNETATEKLIADESKDSIQQTA